MSYETLIVISLRGGADALNMIVPYRDYDYYRLRPSLAISQPGKALKAAVDLDGFFGLHPSLSPLLPFYRNGQLAFIHAVGWPGNSHSHFEAWEEIESGAVGTTHPKSGWLARYLQLRSPLPPTPLRAVAFAEILPRLLTGALGVSALRQLEDFRLAIPKDGHPLHNLLDKLYRNSPSSLGPFGIQTLNALATVDQLVSADRDKKTARGYPQTTFGAQLHALEKLIHAEIGLEAASVELGGWDTHFFQGTTDGLMANRLNELATGLATFVNNLKDDLDRVLIVVMSEFGRRAGENGSAGTDHGQAGVMMLLGASVHGGQVYGNWPGLSDARLATPGDLAITTDFRDVLSELVNVGLGREASAQIFPDYRASRVLGVIG
ncbi:MAG: DUF1501 domain-containing protein [Acidobacteriota bacterium]